MTALAAMHNVSGFRGNGNANFCIAAWLRHAFSAWFVLAAKKMAAPKHRQV